MQNLDVPSTRRRFRYPSSHAIEQVFIHTPCGVGHAPDRCTVKSRFTFGWVLAFLSCKRRNIALSALGRLVARSKWQVMLSRHLSALIYRIPQNTRQGFTTERDSTSSPGSQQSVLPVMPAAAKSGWNFLQLFTPHVRPAEHALLSP